MFVGFVFISNYTGAVKHNEYYDPTNDFYSPLENTAFESYNNTLTSNQHYSVPNETGDY